MSNLVNIYAETDADIIGDDASPTLSLKNTSTGPGLVVDKIGGGNVSLAVVRIIGSGASQPAFSIEDGGFASITSVVLTTVANTDFAIRVKIGTGTDDIFRWIPVFKDAALNQAAAIE